MNKDHEDFGLDRRIGFKTDDEENQGYGGHHDDHDGSDSDGEHCPLGVSTACNDHITWPQTFRQSMELLTSTTPPSYNFLTGTTPTKKTNIAHSTTPHQRPSMTRGSIEEHLLSDASVGAKKHSAKLAPQLSRFASDIGPPPEPRCSFLQTLLNSVNCLCGIGLLSTPYAIRQGGWWSIVLLFIFGVITCYTGILLKRCLDSSPDLKTYPDIGLAAFGVPGRICLAVVLYMELYASCVEYLIMMSDNLSALFPKAHLDFAGIYLDSHLFCYIISTLSILPTVWLRNLSLLSYISVGGVITAVLVAVCLLWVGVVDGVGFHPGGSALDLAKLPVTIGLFGFCYGGHSVFPNIYSSMKTPSQFPSVLVISFAVSFFMYAAVGICGFLMFGNEIKSQFTLNMPAIFVASKVAAWTTVIAPVTKFAITITPVAFCLEELLPPSQQSHGTSILIRTCLMFSTLVVALTVPYFAIGGKAIVIDGVSMADEIKAVINGEVIRMREAIGKVPGLAVILAGDRRDSKTYIRNKMKACEETSIRFVLTKLPEDCSDDEVSGAVSKFNDDPSVHGILVQLPLPRIGKDTLWTELIKFPKHQHLDEEKILNVLRLEKDVDGFHPLNMRNLALEGKEPLFIPCTPKGCIEILLRSGVNIMGKKAVVIGRSNIVGIPMSLLLQRHHATVSTVHELTTNPECITRKADILVSAAGVPNLVRGSWIKPGAFVIDVGTNPIEDPDSKYGYRLMGDDCYEEAVTVASAITPVPGGVGAAVKLQFIARSDSFEALSFPKMSP